MNYSLLGDMIPDCGLGCLREVGLKLTFLIWIILVNNLTSQNSVLLCRKGRCEDVSF